jgi:hypothetical protein
MPMRFWLYRYGYRHRQVGIRFYRQGHSHHLLDALDPRDEGECLRYRAQARAAIIGI